MDVEEYYKNSRKRILGNREHVPIPQYFLYKFRRKLIRKKHEHLEKIGWNKMKPFQNTKEKIKTNER